MDSINPFNDLNQAQMTKIPTELISPLDAEQMIAGQIYALTIAGNEGNLLDHELKNQAVKAIHEARLFLEVWEENR